MSLFEKKITTRHFVNTIYDYSDIKERKTKQLERLVRSAIACRTKLSEYSYSVHLTVLSLSLAKHI